MLQFKKMSCCTGEVEVESPKSSCQCFEVLFSFSFLFVFFFLFVYFLFFALFCLFWWYLVLVLQECFYCSSSTYNILAGLYLVRCDDCVVSWPSWVLLCALIFFSLVFYFCPPGCVLFMRDFILMGLDFNPWTKF